MSVPDWRVYKSLFTTIVATRARSAAVIGSESLGAFNWAELLFFEDCDFVVIRRIMTSDRMLPFSVTEA